MYIHIVKHRSLLTVYFLFLCLDDSILTTLWIHDVVTGELMLSRKKKILVEDRAQDVEGNPQTN